MALSVALATFWRMRGEVRLPGTVASGRDRSESGLRDRPRPRPRPSGPMGWPQVDLNTGPPAPPFKPVLVARNEDPRWCSRPPLPQSVRRTLGWSGVAMPRPASRAAADGGAGRCGLAA
jgi:hypothetical protein